MICQTCGVDLAAGLSFCTRCGSKVGAPPTGVSTKLCKACGAIISQSTKFCEACGAAMDQIQQTTPLFHPLPSSPSTPGYQPVPAGGGASPWQSATGGTASMGGTTPQQRSGGLMKLLFAGIAVLALLAVTVVGGIAYLGYRAKKKVEKIQQAFHDKDVNKITSELGLDKVAEKVAPNSALAASDDDRSFEISDAAGWKTYTGSAIAVTSTLVPAKGWSRCCWCILPEGPTRLRNNHHHTQRLSQRYRYRLHLLWSPSRHTGKCACRTLQFNSRRRHPPESIVGGSGKCSRTESLL